MSEFREEIEHAINRCSQENGSNTPDFVLAAFLDACLTAFDEATVARDRWYGVPLEPAQNAPESNIRPAQDAPEGGDTP